MRALVWTDGSAGLQRATTGGWACLVELYSGPTRLIKSALLYGYLPLATNNQAELTAVIQALAYIGAITEDTPNQPSKVIVHTDSMYVVRAVNGMKNPTTNFDYLRRLQDMKDAVGSVIEARWVRGHNGNEKNELVDQAADAAARRESMYGTSQGNRERRIASYLPRNVGRGRRSRRLNGEAGRAAER